MTLLINLFTGELSSLIESVKHQENSVSQMGFLVTLGLSGLMGITVTLAIFIVNGIASPVAMNLSGITKDLFLTYLGFVMFDDAKMTLLVGLGLGLSFIGATSYLYKQY